MGTNPDAKGPPAAAAAAGVAHPLGALGEKQPRFVLITQCLQDDFFKNADCKLRLPDEEVTRILRGGDFDGAAAGRSRKRENDAKGPLGMFLRHSIGARMKDTGEDVPLLHVINIQDWHYRGRRYDAERKAYGLHCEAGTDGAKYLSSLRDYLDPRRGRNGPRSSERTGDESSIEVYKQGRLRVYHIRSDSVFDFGAGSHSELEHCLDFLCYKSTDEIENTSRIHLHGKRKSEEPDPPMRLYVAVIGVYTDIKVLTLLMGLRSQYKISNLAVSDALTGSPSLDRHIGALDYAVKVLQVEVIHHLNNLLRYLGLEPKIDEDRELVGDTSFGDFEMYHQDKLRVLAHRERIMGEYLRLSRDRAFRVFRRVDRTSFFLMWAGVAFLAIAILGAGYETFRAAIVGDSLGKGWMAMMGGAGLMGLLQMAGGFLTKAHKHLPKSLADLVKMRIILENHSLKSALANFHLTTPETLRHNVDAEKAERQIRILAQQVGVLEQIERSTSAALVEFGLVNGSAETARKKDGAGEDGDAVGDDASVEEEGALEEAGAGEEEFGVEGAEPVAEAGAGAGEEEIADPGESAPEAP